ncbi:MAG: hypothetical protein N2651_04885 [Fimbriimonadales bacterium]|nr:hypothetical protein [Fimbriimonadales bacterium]
MRSISSTDRSSLRLLNDGICPPEVNMARDLALLEAFERGEIPPTLRVYQWASPAITYGVNQQLPPRLVEACQQLGIPLFRRPTGGKAVLHGHDLTMALVLGNLTPQPPLRKRRGGIGCVESASIPPSPFTERGARGMRSEEGVGRLQHHASDSSLTSLPLRGRGEGARLYPRQVYLQLAPALIEAFRQVGVPAAQGGAIAPDPRSIDDGGDCFATPAIADIVQAETGVKLMGCALLVRGACVLVQASIPLRLPEVPVESLFGHPHPVPPPLEADSLMNALYESLGRIVL